MLRAVCVDREIHVEGMCGRLPSSADHFQSERRGTDRHVDAGVDIALVALDVNVLTGVPLSSTSETRTRWLFRMRPVTRMRCATFR